MIKIKVFRDKYEDALERKVNEFLATKFTAPTWVPVQGFSLKMQLKNVSRTPEKVQVRPALADGEMMVVVTYE